jgi:hypothetical protein
LLARKKSGSLAITSAPAGEDAPVVEDEVTEPDTTVEAPKKAVKKTAK